MNSRNIVVACICLFAAGCTRTLGNPAVRETTTQTRVNKGMSQSDIRALLGEPTYIALAGDGDQVWTYQYVQRETKWPIFIPIVGEILLLAAPQTVGQRDVWEIKARFSGEGIAKDVVKTHVTCEAGNCPVLVTPVQ